VPARVSNASPVSRSAAGVRRPSEQPASQRSAGCQTARSACRAMWMACRVYESVSYGGRVCAVSEEGVSANCRCAARRAPQPGPPTVNGIWPERNEYVLFLKGDYADGEPTPVCAVLFKPCLRHALQTQCRRHQATRCSPVRAVRLVRPC